MLSSLSYTFFINYNVRSTLWHSLGLQTYWRRHLQRQAPQCHLKYNSNGESVQLLDKARIKLEQLYVAFYVLFIGYVLALIQFLRERFIHNPYPIEENAFSLISWFKLSAVIEISLFIEIDLEQ